MSKKIFCLKTMIAYYSFKYKKKTCYVIFLFNHLAPLCKKYEYTNLKRKMRKK